MNATAIMDIPPRVQRQAATWLVELQADSVSEDTRARWRKWHDARPEHQQAWQCIEAFGSRLKQLPPPLAHAALTVPGSADRRRAIKTLAVLLFAGSGAWLAEDNTPWREWTADRRTRVGERSVVMLADGTRVDMNGDTAINIIYTDHTRLVRLVSGEIMITTAHDPQAGADIPARPFLVETAHGSIRALGTRFTVRRTDDEHAVGSKVAVFEGAVEIRPNGMADARVLKAGQRASFTQVGFGQAAPADENATAWTQGMIIAQDMPLDVFLKELARYRPGAVRYDPALSKLRVTGTYPLADTDRILDMLQTTLPIDVKMFTRYWVTVSPRSG